VRIDDNPGSRQAFEGREPRSKRTTAPEAPAEDAGELSPENLPGPPRQLIDSSADVAARPWPLPGRSPKDRPHSKPAHTTIDFVSSTTLPALSAPGSVARPRVVRRSRRALAHIRDSLYAGWDPEGPSSTTSPSSDTRVLGAGGQARRKTERSRYRPAMEDVVTLVHTEKSRPGVRRWRGRLGGQSS